MVPADGCTDDCVDFGLIIAAVQARPLLIYGTLLNVPRNPAYMRLIYVTSQDPA